MNNLRWLEVWRAGQRLPHCGRPHLNFIVYNPNELGESRKMLLRYCCCCFVAFALNVTFLFQVLFASALALLTFSFLHVTSFFIYVLSCTTLWIKSLENTFSFPFLLVNSSKQREKVDRKNSNEKWQWQLRHEIQKKKEKILKLFNEEFRFGTSQKPRGKLFLNFTLLCKKFCRKTATEVDCTRAIY